MKEFKNNYKEVDSALIISDQSYQRRLKPSEVRQIVDEWNENIANPPKVSYRNGKYYVFNGQHTVRARVEMNGGKDLPIYCRVYYGMTQKDEAELFYQQEGEAARPLTKLEGLSSRLTAENPKVLEYKTALEDECGVICDFDSKNTGNKKIACHASLFNIFEKNGKDYMVELVTTIIKAWGGDAQSLRREVVCGMDVFMTTYAGEYNRNRLIKSLMQISPMAIVREGKEDKYTTGNKRFAKVIVGAYNKGQRQENRLVFKF